MPALHPDVCPLCMHDVIGEFNCRKCMNIMCRQKFHGICATNSGKSNCPTCGWKYIAECGTPTTNINIKGGKKRKTKKTRKTKKSRKSRKARKTKKNRK